MSIIHVKLKEGVNTFYGYTHRTIYEATEFINRRGKLRIRVKDDSGLAEDWQHPDDNSPTQYFERVKTEDDKFKDLLLKS